MMGIAIFAKREDNGGYDEVYDRCQIWVQNCNKWFLINQYFYKMIQPSIPLTTIKRFARNKINPSLNISCDFYTELKTYSKNFLDAIVLQIVDVCEQSNKEKITPKIFYEALQKLGLEEMGPSLKSLEEKLEDKKKKKKLKKKRIAENIERVYRLAESEEKNENEKREKGMEELRVKLEMKLDLEPMELPEEDFRLEIDLTENDNENNEKGENGVIEIL